MGPTCSGKTALALKLVQHFPFHLVSVDSTLVYRNMDIGTAKPSKAELHQTPHELINICDVSEPYSAGQFCQDVKNHIIAIQHAGKIPLLLGGTMMYFHALQSGIAELPVANASLRKQISQEAEDVGWPRLHENLQKILPEVAAKIHPNDAQRIQRALEIYYLTLNTTWPRNPILPSCEFINLLLCTPNRQQLRTRIAERFDAMLRDGFINEVTHFFNRPDVHRDLPAMRAVGYRQVFSYLEGQYDMATMREKAITATAQLAKRQMTWLRSWPTGTCFNAGNPNLDAHVMAYIRSTINKE